jgi:hypothetical protein
MPHSARLDGTGKTPNDVRLTHEVLKGSGAVTPRYDQILGAPRDVTFVRPRILGG